MKMTLPKEWYEEKLPAEEGHEIGAGCPAVPLFGSVFATLPDGERVQACAPSRLGLARAAKDFRKQKATDIDIFDPWLPKLK